MLPRLDVILAALEDERGEVQVWELAASKFRVSMYDSRSASAIGGKVKLVRRSYAEREGRLVRRFKVSDVESAAGR